MHHIEALNHKDMYRSLMHRIFNSTFCTRGVTDPAALFAPILTVLLNKEYYYYQGEC